ncbi:FUSC family protein [Gallaecimonas sp. GXIMD1310]|uniref:FUSC family protein n=1 Tax=Gallaecimonas sp. GXIMD1310 TaxID=3131926 RepID=UPI0032538269
MQLSALVPNRYTLRYAIKGVIAMALALSVAISLGLDRPYWALISAVFLQIRPESGLVIEKALCQMAGTLVGGLAGIAMLMTLGQHLAWLMAALTLWIGLNAAASAMVHRVNFIYAYAIAAVTATLVAILSLIHPDGLNQQVILDTAWARASEIVVGALCASTVSLLLWPVRVKTILRHHAKRVVNKTLEYLAVELDTNGTHDQRHTHIDGIFESLITLNDDSSAVVYESPEGRGRARAANLLCQKVLSLLAIIQIFGRFRRNHPQLLSQSQHQLLDDMHHSFKAMAAAENGPQAMVLLRQLRRQLLHYRAGQVTRVPIQARLIHTSMEMVNELMVLLKAFDAINTRNRINLKAPSLGNYKDPLLGVLTGFRSALVFAVGALTWALSGWPGAVVMMVLPVTFSVMFARLTSPNMPLAKLLAGSLLAVPVAWLFGLPLLSHYPGQLPVLLLVMGVPFFFGLVAMAQQNRLQYGIGFCIPYTLLIMPGASHGVTLSHGASALGIVVGMLLLYGTFWLLAPPGSTLMQRRLLAASAGDLTRLQLHRDPPLWFNGRMAERLMRLAQLEQTKPLGQRYLTDLGLTCLNLGHVTLRLHRQLAHTHDPRIKALLKRWQQVLASAFLAATEGRIEPQFRRTSHLLVRAIAKSGQADLQLDVIEGTMTRLALTLERTANTSTLG